MDRVPVTKGPMFASWDCRGSATLRTLMELVFRKSASAGAAYFAEGHCITYVFKHMR